ncbi:MAG: hypothetical protein LBP35_02425 [Candidatus Ancillula trichonymphae]|nr:hypothetical protein [Candidatus Ancillula trichonymphae]
MSSSRKGDVDGAVNIVKCIPSWQSKLKDTTDNQQWDFIVGYDLVSEWEVGHKTDDYAKAFFDDPDIQAHPVDFYFHDGESNWVDDNNVVAAFAMGYQTDWAWAECVQLSCSYGAVEG